MARKAAASVKKAANEQPMVLATPSRPEDTHFPVTASERALFAACFGRLIDQILAEQD